MDDIYLNGVWLALLISFIKVSISISALLSQRARNMKKIALYYSLSECSFTSRKPVGVLKFVAYLFYMFLLAPLFSWLTVISAAWGWFAWVTNKAPTPEKIKEVQYKIAHLDLTKEELIEIQIQISEALGIPMPIATGENSDNGNDPYTLVLDSYFGHNEVTVYPQNMTMTFYSLPDDPDCVFHSKYEYKFDGEILMMRLIEDYVDNITEKEFNVKDSVVLESEIRKRRTERRYTPASIDEMIADYFSEIHWHPVSRYDIRYFVMSKHPELFSSNEFKRIVRSDLERLRIAKQKTIDELTKMGLTLKNTPEGIEFEYPDSISEKEREKMERFFEKSSTKASLGTTLGEMRIVHKYEQDLLKLLGESVAA